MHIVANQRAGLFYGRIGFYGFFLDYLIKYFDRYFLLIYLWMVCQPYSQNFYLCYFPEEFFCLFSTQWSFFEYFVYSCLNTGFLDIISDFPLKKYNLNKSANEVEYHHLTATMTASRQLNGYLSYLQFDLINHFMHLLLIMCRHTAL